MAGWYLWWWLYSSWLSGSFLRQDGYWIMKPGRRFSGARAFFQRLKWKSNFHSISLFLESCGHSYRTGCSYAPIVPKVAITVTIILLCGSFSLLPGIFVYHKAGGVQALFRECKTEFHFWKRCSVAARHLPPLVAAIGFSLFQKIRFENDLIFF